MTVPFLHINHLLANKKAVYRSKDQIDVMKLEKIKKIPARKKERIILFFSHFKLPLLIFAPNFGMGMTLRLFKSFTVAAFMVFLLVFSLPGSAADGGGHEPEKKEGFDARKIIFGHVLNAHEFHFLDYKGKDGKMHPVTLPLPVIIYSPQRGFTSFMSSKFEHGHKPYDGYKLENGVIKAVKEDGVTVDESVKVYDISLTRNVVQMLLALVVFVWIMLAIAKRYKRGEGVKTAPRGSQSLLEPVITFVRDEVAKPNLGHKYEKYLPYLLTLFFFILINNLFGLIPGSANVTGNIAFTLLLGVISFIVIIFSSNKHYWGHIFNPPGVPLGVKFILVPVEFLSFFIKPFALIIRLFANMVAGHIIIICLISLIFIFGQLNQYAGWGTTIVSIAFTVFIYMIEVLVAFIQAFVFTLLTSVFIGQAFEGEHHEAHEH